jgi:hypothetical protein
MANLQNLTPWKPGQSGNLNGRPVGSRTVFSEAFLKDLAEVWSDEGREAMLKTAKTNPTVFFATRARLIPQDVKLTVEQQLPGNLSGRSSPPFAKPSLMPALSSPVRCWSSS